MQNCTTQIKTQLGLTSHIPLKLGVKQGDPISPTLFLLYLLPLQWLLKKHCPTTLTNCNHLCYADDMLLIAHNRPTINLLLTQVAIYCTYTDMNINKNKSLYSYTNDITQLPMEIIHPSLNNSPQLLVINTISKQTNYKYLGLEINICLDFSQSIKELIEKYKRVINNICRKKFLGPNLIIKLINAVAIPKISYIMYFIYLQKDNLENLDNITKNKICHTFKIPSITPETYWFTTHNLNSIYHTNIIKLYNNYFDRGLNGISKIKKNSILKNNTQENPFTPYNPTISLLLKWQNIKLKENQHPTIPTTINNDKTPTNLDIFTDASFYKKDQKEGCAFIIPTLNIEKNFEPHLPASSTNFELQAILNALETIPTENSVNIYTDSKSAILAIENFNSKTISEKLKSPSFQP